MCPDTHDWTMQSAHQPHPGRSARCFPRGRHFVGEYGLWQPVARCQVRCPRHHLDAHRRRRTALPPYARSPFRDCRPGMRSVQRSSVPDSGVREDCIEADRRVILIHFVCGPGTSHRTALWYSCRVRNLLNPLVPERRGQHRGPVEKAPVVAGTDGT